MIRTNEEIMKMLGDIREKTADYKERNEMEDTLFEKLHQEVEVGDGITLKLYSDAHAFTVIARTKWTLTIQRDKATLSDEFKPNFVSGGFSVICTNQDNQKWLYSPNPKGEIIKLHWSKKLRRWNAPDRYSSVSLGKHEYYDYNF